MSFNGKIKDIIIDTANCFNLNIAGTTNVADTLNVAGQTNMVGNMDCMSTANFYAPVTFNDSVYIPTLSNVDNTSDLNKPISTATKDALILKADNTNNFANIVSNTIMPKNINTDEYITFNEIDTNTWSINPGNTNELICQVAGSCNFMAQYKLNNTNTTNIATATGWMEINDMTTPVVSSSNNMLLVNYSYIFNVGDKVKFGIKSTGINIKCTNVNIAVTYVNNYINIASNNICPVDANNNEYVVLSTLDNTTWLINTIDTMNAELLCNYIGIWQFTVMYLIENILNENSNDTDFVTWIEVNGSALPNSCAIGSVPYAKSKNIVSFSFTHNYNLNDVIQFGIRANNNKVRCNNVLISGINMTSYSNIYSDITTPVNINSNEYIILEDVDKNNWNIGTDQTELIASVSGSWQFNVMYHVTCTTNNRSTLSGFVNYNGTNIPNIKPVVILDTNNQKYCLTFSFVKNVLIGDIIKFGISSNSNKIQCIGYNDTISTVYSSAVFITTSCLSTPISEILPIMGYMNSYSIIEVPEQVNSNEYITINYIDTSDWTIDNTDMTKLICANEGPWEFITKYQLSNINNSINNDNVTGWITINDVDINNSGNSSSVSYDENKNLLIVSYCAYFNIGDIVQFGIRSNSSGNILNIGCTPTFTLYGDMIPSVSISASRVNTFANFYSTVNTPTISNNDEYIALDNVDNDINWNINNTELTAEIAGRWQFNIIYQMKGKTDLTNASNSMITGWVEKYTDYNYTVVPNTTTYSYVVRNGINNMMIISYTDNFIVGDKIRFGIKSSNINNIQCVNISDNSGITIYPVTISAIKLISYMNLNNSSIISSSNVFHYIPLTNPNVDDDWQLEDANTMICSGPGTWKFTLICNITNTNDVSTIVKVDNNELYDVDTNIIVDTLNGKSTLITTYVSSFIKDQTIAFGIKNTNSINNIQLSCIKISVPLGPIEISTFSPTFVNCYSTEIIPTVLNTEQFVTFNYIDTSRWFIGNKNNTMLICNSDGTWSFKVKYQVSNVSSNTTKGNFITTLYVNGTKTTNTITLTVDDFDGKNVLIGIYSGKFAAGDVIQFGITYNASLLNIQCISYTDYTGIFNPSVSISAIEVPSSDIILASSVLPTIPNTSQYIVLTGTSYNNWTNNNNILTCNITGSYQILMEYQITNQRNYDISANDNTVYGWIEQDNGTGFTYIENSGASGYVTKSHGINTFSISYTSNFNKGDKIRFGIIAASLNCVCTNNKLIICNMINNANIHSVYSAPLTPNTNEMITLYDIDSNNWLISELDETMLICQRTGSWEFIIQHHISNISGKNLSANNAMISSYIFVNGEYVENSNVGGYVNKINGKDVLTNIYNGYFNRNDTIQFAICSISNDGNLNVQCKSYTDICGNTINPVTITASQFSDSVNFQSIVDNNTNKATFQNLLQSVFDTKKDIYSAGVNIYSHSNNITNINTNQYIQLDKISSNEWVIYPADNTHIICMNSGAWQFIIKYDIDTSNNNIIDSSGSMVYGWITVNGIVETASYTNKSFMIPGSNSLVFAYYKALNSGDVVQFGIRTNNSNITCNSSSIILNNSNSGTNFSSTAILPTAINTNQYIQFNKNTYPFWINNPGNNTELICKLKNNWQFIVQYTLYNSSNVDINANIDGWIEIKNIDNNEFEKIDDSNNSITVNKKGSTTVLIYSIIQNFNLGDIIRFGIKSSNSNVKTYSILDMFGTKSSSVSVSISSVIAFSNIYTSIDASNGMIKLDTYDTSNWFINNDDMLVCMNSGTWQFFISYQLNNTSANPLALLETIIKINNVRASNFSSKLSVTENGEKSILNVCFTRCFNLGDIIELDVSGNNITCTSVNISAIKLSNNVNTINTYSTATFNGDVNLVGENNKLGFFGVTPIERQSTALLSGGDTLDNMYTILRKYGLIV